MLLSLVIPTHNRAQTLISRITDYHEKITAEISAHEHAFEIIIVNDASNDDTKTLCNELSQKIPNLRSLHLARNLGPGPARNEGTKIANGEYIWFLDDDDQIQADQLNQIFLTIQSKPDIITHSLNSVHSSKQNLIANIVNFHEKQEVFNCILKRSLILENNILFGDHLHEDIAFLIKALTYAKIVVNVPENIIFKNNTKDAITDKMSIRRIDGYIKSYEDIINNIAIAGATHSQIHTAFLGVMIYLIQKTKYNDALHLLEYLKTQDFSKLHITEKSRYNHKSTNFEYAAKIFVNNLTEAPKYIFDSVNKVFQTHLSCKDLEASLFLAPTEIRACCKRFFVDGKQKGDVVLLDANADISYTDIIQAKQRLIKDINTGSCSECSGCPYLERYDSQKSPKIIDYISFENFSYCNMRCTYCSPKYYDGTEAKYDSLEILQQLVNTPDGISDSVHVVFGGGEPTLSPKFQEINNILRDHPNITKVRLLSNSLRHKNNVNDLLQNKKYQLVTSIDAGTQEKFTEIRKKGQIKDVFSNLKNYSANSTDKQRITIKYIITAQNYDLAELQSYVALLKEYDLITCLFQISCDFTVEAPMDEMIVACHQLNALLYQAGADHVFFDDLIRDRIKITDELLIKIKDKVGLLVDVEDISTDFIYILWGQGLQANWILENTRVGRKGLIKKIVSNEIELNEFINKNGLHYSSIRIIPAGVQSTYEIIQNIKSSGYGSNIYRSLML